MTFRTIAPFLLLLATACTTSPDADPAPGPAEGYRVALTAARSATRTALDEDGRTARWSPDDRIALWAHDGASYVLSAQTFGLYAYRGVYSAADFSSTLSSPMPAGSYRYHAVYPVPASVSGTQVTYRLPATQHGTYDGACDIMHAATSGPALDENPHESMSLDFRHLCHAVRIEIPAGRNLLGRPVKRLEITFPRPVAGDLTFDAASPSPEPVLANGTRTLVLDLPGTGMTDAEGVYAWAFIAPGPIDGDIVFRAYDSRGYQTGTIAAPLARTLEAGHTTPVSLTVPAPRPLTYLDFTEAANHLGEALTRIRLTAPDALFVRPFGAEDATEFTASRNADGQFRVPVYADTHPAAALENRTLTIDYESQHALLEGRTVVLPHTLRAEAANTVSMTVPYLFEEDFGGVNGSEHNVEAGGASTSASNSATGLGFMGLTDAWSGQRIGSQSGRAVKISSVRGLRQWRGRMTAPPLSGLKADAGEVAVTVEFYIDGYQSKGSTCTCTFGFSDDDANTNLTYDDGLTTRTADFTPPTDGGYDRIATRLSYTTLPGQVNADSRPSWLIDYGSGGGAFDYRTYYLFIDNIRISLGKEIK
ncbi:fimbrillin family protein [uncultured Alistipes sp.]|jgi:hypothetical protein|uniref:fimbrillin family protein n=1 Tax=uncultured Alistipes sp. TaxID=538949 RepID=UPI0026382AC6|nr:fimbrillin family protein [uncultured Alistipes sp.]